MYAIWDIALANFAKSRQGLWRKMRQNLIGTVIYIRAMYLRVTLFSRVYHEIFFMYVSRQSVCIDLPSSRLNLTALLLRKYDIWEQKFAIYPYRDHNVQSRTAFSWPHFTRWLLITLLLAWVHFDLDVPPTLKLIRR